MKTQYVSPWYNRVWLTGRKTPSDLLTYGLTNSTFLFVLWGGCTRPYRRKTADLASSIGYQAGWKTDSRQLPPRSQHVETNMGWRAEINFPVIRFCVLFLYSMQTRQCLAGTEGGCCLEYLNARTTHWNLGNPELSNNNNFMTYLCKWEYVLQSVVVLIHR